MICLGLEGWVGGTLLVAAGTLLVAAGAKRSADCVERAESLAADCRREVGRKEDDLRSARERRTTTESVR